MFAKPQNRSHLNFGVSNSGILKTIFDLKIQIHFQKKKKIKKKKVDKTCMGEDETF